MEILVSAGRQPGAAHQRIILRSFLARVRAASDPKRSLGLAVVGRRYFALPGESVRIGPAATQSHRFCV
jgi:hypothetical protein